MALRTRALARYARPRAPAFAAAPRSFESRLRLRARLRPFDDPMQVYARSPLEENPEMASKGRGFRAETIEGFEVLVGKGDAENDRLTFRVAEPHDLWLHVAGPPGSHVVVRNPDRLPELPRTVVQRAAELAAWHSKARGARGKVEVHVCRVSDVSKPPGFAPGEVRLRRWDAIKVYPRAAGAEGEPA